MRLHRFLAAGLCLIVAAGLVTPARAQLPALAYDATNFPSGDKKIKIRVEHFAQRGNEKRPVIVLAPESASFKTVSPVYQSIAANLAEEGYLVLIVHFFDRTGHDGIAKDDIKEKMFRQWMEALGDGVQYARRLANADPGRVGLLGFSLGGYLAVAVAADANVKVQAVGCYFGGVPKELWPKIKKLPPVLVVHGEKDDVVPVSEAYKIIKFCEKNNLKCEHKIYPSEGHLFINSLGRFVVYKAIWMGRDFDRNRAIAEGIRTQSTVREAVVLGVTFFKTHLK
jgi:carboxymethylenebutenolidase